MSGGLVDLSTDHYSGILHLSVQMIKQTAMCTPQLP